MGFIFYLQKKKFIGKTWNCGWLIHTERTLKLPRFSTPTFQGCTILGDGKKQIDKIKTGRRDKKRCLLWYHVTHHMWKEMIPPLHQFLCMDFGGSVCYFDQWEADIREPYQQIIAPRSLFCKYLWDIGPSLGRAGEIWAGPQMWPETARQWPRYHLLCLRPDVRNTSTATRPACLCYQIM